MIRHLLLVFALFSVAGCASDWRASSRESSGLAPTPDAEPRAVIQAYAARVWGWRGWFADHTWVASKPAGADHYTIYEVIGWGVRRGRPALRIARDLPDRRWYGAEPRLLVDLRGDKADSLIKPLDHTARRYPYPGQYRAFPGPNSNTFTAWLAQELPELGLDLPWRAIGKSYALPSSPDK